MGHPGGDLVFGVIPKRSSTRDQPKSRARKRGGSISSRTTARGVVLFDCRFSYPDPQDPERRRTSTKRGFRTRKDAQTFLNGKLADVSRGVHVEPSSERLDVYLDRWLLGLQVGAQTLNGYKTKARVHIKPHLGQKPIGKITGADLSALYRKLEREGSEGGKGPLAPASVRQVHEILSGALKAALRDGLVIRNAATMADPPRTKDAKSHEHTTWMAAELRTFLAKTKEHRHAAIWAFMASTGVRRGEALSLRWADVDLDAGTVALRQTVGMARGQLVYGGTKSGKPRVIRIDAATVAVLRAHRKAQVAERLELGERWKDHGLVFARGGFRLPAEVTAGGPLNPEKMTAAFVTAIEALELPRVRLHDLRHGWATMALRAGVPVKVVQERLGHSHASITLGIYAHVMPGMDKDAAETVAALFA